ncbi:MAG: putative holin [Actinomycetota bacterium]
MIPLPRASVLAGVMLIGVTLGITGALLVAGEITTSIRPAAVVALAVGIPSLLGTLTILMSGRQWTTAVGAMVVAVGPGCLGALTAMQVSAGV